MIKTLFRSILVVVFFSVLATALFAQGRATPIPLQLEKKGLLERLNRSSQTRWEWEWDEVRQKVLQLRFGLSRPTSGEPAEAARRFIREQSDLLGISAMTEMVLVDQKTSLVGTHIRFAQRLQGIPIYGSHISVHIDERQRVFWVNNQSASADQIANQVRLAEDQARAVVFDDLKPDFLTLRGPIASALYLLQPEPPAKARQPAPSPLEPQALRYVWRILVPANEPLGSWEYLIDAESGSILQKSDLLQFARARVFFPNPVVTLKDPTLRDPLAKDTGTARTTADANCGKSAVPPQAYREVELLGLSSSGMLDGQYVTTGAGSVPASTRAKADPNFLYERCDPRFDEVNVYYTLDSVQRFIQQLGFRESRSVNDRPVPVNANGYISFGRTQDQSFYDPAVGEITYGLGGIHDAEDGEIVTHEYGHSVQDNQVPGFGSSGEAKALGEGFSDILAALFFVPYSDGFHDELIGEWDATFYDTTNAVPRLRTVDSPKTFDDYDPTKSEHRNGMIWSASLWDFYNRLGGGAQARDLVMRLLLESQFLYHPGESFAEAAEALVAADQKVTNGASQALLIRVFNERKILRIAPDLPAAQLVEAEPNDSAATAQPLFESQHVISGEISSNSDVDVYRFRTRANQLYVVEIYAKRLPSRSSLDSFLEILDANGNRIPRGDGFLENDDIVDGVIQDSRIVFANSPAQDLLIRVSSFRNESHGAYLLVIYPTENALRVPRVSSDQTTFTGVALSNSGSTDAIVGLILLDDNGQTVSGDNPRLIALPAGKQIAFLDTEMFGYKSQASAWLEVHSNSPDVKGYFLYGNSNSLLGESASVSASSDSVFMLASASVPPSDPSAAPLETEINLVNPNAAQASAQISVLAVDGKEAEKISITIPPFGHLRKSLSEWVKTPLAAGHIRVRSDVPLTGFEVHGDQRKTGLRLRSVAETSLLLYVIHFAEAPIAGSIRFFTILNLVNTTDQTMQLTIVARDDSGIPFEDLRPALVILGPRQTLEKPVRELFGISNLAKPYIGSLEIRGFGPGALGTIRFGQTDHQYLVGVAIESAPKNKIVFSQVANGDAGGGVSYLTGVALFNPISNGRTAFYTLKVFAGNGTLVAQSGVSESPSAIFPGQRVVKLLSELIPGLKPILGGYIVIESNVALFSFELVLLPKSLTAVPAQ